MKFRISKEKFLLILFIVLIAIITGTVGYFYQSRKFYKVDEVSELDQYLGKNIVIEGTLYYSESSPNLKKPPILKFKDISIYCWDQERYRTPNISYEGINVRVRGKLSWYESSPEDQWLDHYEIFYEKIEEIDSL